jgi:hypothetical protein
MLRLDALLAAAEASELAALLQLLDCRGQASLLARASFHAPSILVNCGPVSLS